MMSLAARVGILVPDLRLFPLADLDGIPAVWKSRGGNAFAIRRFDRGPNGRRIHTENLAQAFGMFPEQKYERHSYANIATFLLSRAGLQAALDFTRRVVFSVLIGNGDMHLKNGSLLYKNPLRPTLSPAYDLLFRVWAPVSRWGWGAAGKSGTWRQSGSCNTPPPPDCRWFP